MCSTLTTTRTIEYDLYISNLPLPVSDESDDSIAIVDPLIVVESDNDRLRRKSANNSRMPPNGKFTRSEAPQKQIQSLGIRGLDLCA